VANKVNDRPSTTKKTKWRKDISKAIDEIDDYFFRRALYEESVKARAAVKREVAQNLLLEGVNLEFIAKGTGLSIEEVMRIKQSLDRTS
jgi:hypothetical protein